MFNLSGFRVLKFVFFKVEKLGLFAQALDGATCGHLSSLSLIKHDCMKHRHVK